MIVPSSLQRLYDQWLIFVEEAGNRVEGTLSVYCRNHGYVFEGRVKSLESVAEKVESGRYSSWDSLEDLYACTVAVPLHTNEATVHQYLGNRFEVLKVKKRGGVPKPPDVFRFDSSKVIARLKRPPGIPSDPGMSAFAVRFEIQVKSLLEFAWSKTTHALTYKSRLVDWKRYRLAAHLKAAVEQADFLLTGFEGAAQLVLDGWCYDVEDKRVLREVFLELARGGHIPSELVPKDWSRFIDNLYTAAQVLTGHYPKSRSDRSLQSRDRICEFVREYFTTTDSRSIPRSLSLFQVVLGVLCSSGMFDGHSDKYHVLVNSPFSSVFPNAALPGGEFSTMGRE